MLMFSLFAIITPILTFQEKTYLLLLPIMKDSETQFAGRMGTQLYIKKRAIEHLSFLICDSVS